MAKAAVLCIGTELTRGEVVNTNGNVLADALTRHGFEVTAVEIVDDDHERIVESLARLGRANAALVVTGGLGPTTDDITTEAAAALLGLPLERDEASLGLIRERLERLGRPMAASNAKQAEFPRGAQILPNPNGTAPGFSLRIENAVACFMPGVPREMTAMFDASVVPLLAPLVDEAFHQVRLRSYGLPESEVNDRLAGIEDEHRVVIGYRASFPVIEVKVLARDAVPAQAEERARRAADEVHRRLGDVVFGEGDITFAQALGRELVQSGKRLCTAESCTGGLIGQLLTARGGASAFFAGGVVAYENRAKTALLGVPAALIEAHGAVSAEVACAMAEGARTRFDADVAVAVTGVAGPDGGSAEKPVGLVHYAVATRSTTEARHFLFPGDREFIRLRAAYAALGLAYRIVRGVSV
jgi:nicotinamide-nucleotide amidase